MDVAYRNTDPYRLSTVHTFNETNQHTYVGEAANKGATAFRNK